MRTVTKGLPAHEGRGASRNTELEQNPAVRCALAHGVIAVVGAVQTSIGTDVQSMGMFEHSMSEGAEHVAFPIEHDERMLATGKQEYGVASIDCDRSHLAEFEFGW